MTKRPPTEGEQAHVVLVRGRAEKLVYSGDLPDCEAWLALNGDKLLEGDAHFELRDGRPVSLPRAGG
jgi:hypothetical protein